MRHVPARSRSRRAPVAAAAVLLALGTPALAQSRVQPVERIGVAEVTPYAGVILFGNYLDGPLGTSVRSRPAPIGGAQVSVRLAPALSVVGNVGYSRGDLEVGLPVLGGLDVGSSSSWLYDAGLELRVPTASTAIVPFLQAGAGAITTRLSGGPVNTTSTNAAYNLGAGLDVGLGRSAALRVQARDYIGRFSSEKVAGLEARGDVSHNVAVSAGLRFAF